MTFLPLSFAFSLLKISVFCIVAYPVVYGFGVLYKNGLKHQFCKSKRKGHNKTAVITGGSAGIGKETARDFARRGFRVVLACRNLEKTKKVIDDITNETGNKNITVYKLDTSDMQSVRECAKEILNKENRIDILVNNAGIGGSGSSNPYTQEGFELTMATNYYGHFLFTNLLIDLIKKSSPSRIVNVSSGMHMFCLSLDVENLNFEKGEFLRSFKNYPQSKLCNILFNLELSKRLKGTGVTANAIQPGFVATELFSKMDSYSLAYTLCIAKLFAKTEEQGAQTTIHVAVSEEVENVTGKYFDDCKEIKSSSLSQDTNLASKLWRTTVRDLRMQPDEIKI